MSSREIVRLPYEVQRGNMETNLCDEVLEAEVARVFSVRHDAPTQGDIIGLAQRIRDSQKKAIADLIDQCRRLREGSAETATIKFPDEQLADYAAGYKKLKDEHEYLKLCSQVPPVECALRDAIEKWLDDMIRYEMVPSNIGDRVYINMARAAMSVLQTDIERLD